MVNQTLNNRHVQVKVLSTFLILLNLSIFFILTHFGHRVELNRFNLLIADKMESSGKPQSSLDSLKANPLIQFLWGYIFLASGLLVNCMQFCMIPLWYMGKTDVYRRSIRILNKAHWTSKFSRQLSKKAKYKFYLKIVGYLFERVLKGHF